jgi:hypothetical protein
MIHPSLDSETLTAQLPRLLDGVRPDLSGEERWVGEGTRLDIEPLMGCVAEVEAALRERLAADEHELDNDQFEGLVSGQLHAVLRSYDVETLDDPGFWAWLSTGPLWFFVRWREDPDERKREAYEKYLNGRASQECVPLRMFLRAQAIERDGDYDLASSIPRGVDFWRSHVLRVRTGAKKELARAIAQEQRDDRLTVERVREYAKRINRRWSNQVLYLLNDQEARALARGERPTGDD